MSKKKILKPEKSQKSLPDQSNRSISKNKLLGQETTLLSTYISDLACWVCSSLHSKTPQELPELPNLSVLSSVLNPCKQLRNALLKSNKQNCLSKTRGSCLSRTSRNDNTRKPSLFSIGRHRSQQLKSKSPQARYSNRNDDKESSSNGNSQRAQSPEEFNSNFLFKLSSNLLQKMRNLKVKKTQYSLFYKNWGKDYNEEKNLLKSVAQINSVNQKKLRPVALAVQAAIRMRKALRKDYIVLQGVNTGLSFEDINHPYDCELIKLLNKPSPIDCSCINLMRVEIKSSKKKVAEFRSIINLLLRDNDELHNRHKGVVETFKEMSKEKDKLGNLIQELKMMNSPKDNNVDMSEFNAIQEDLENHKKALKGLTHQYNLMEREKNELEDKYVYLLNLSQSDT